MDVKTGFFYVFSLIMLFAAFRVITARNPVHAVLFLMLTFSQAAGIWLLLKAEFLAITLVLVYLGAVMVLFLFVVMMLDIRIDQLRKSFWKNFPLAAVIFAIVAFEMGVVLIGGFSMVDEPKVIPTVVDAAGKVIAVHCDYLPDTKSGTPGSDSVMVLRRLDPGEYRFFDDFHPDTPPARLVAREAGGQ